MLKFRLEEGKRECIRGGERRKRGGQHGRRERRSPSLNTDPCASSHPPPPQTPTPAVPAFADPATTTGTTVTAADFTPSRGSQARRRAPHAAESQGTRALGASRAPCGRGARGHAAYGGRNARIERERRATRAASDRLGRGEVVVVQIGRCVAAFTSSLSCPSDRRALRLTRASPANTHQHPPTPST